MSPQPPCPDPNGCDWRPRSLGGAEVLVCARCGRVQLDASTLERLAGGAALTDPFDPPPGTTPGEKPVRTAKPSITPGAPPPRTSAPTRSPSGGPSPRSASRLFADTVVPFGGSEDLDPETPAPVESRRGGAAGGPTRGGPWGLPPAHPPTSTPTPLPPPPPTGATTVAPRGDIRFAKTIAPSAEISPPLAPRAAPRPATGAEPGLRAAPEPEHALRGATWADADESARRAPVDDSRVPTEETTLGADDARSAPGEPGLSLRAAITRSEEPALGLSVDDTNLPHEGEAFLAPGSRARVRLDGDPDIDPDDLDWRPQRRLLPRVLAAAAFLVVVGGGLAVGMSLIVAALWLPPPVADPEVAAVAPLTPVATDPAPEPEPEPLAAPEPEPEPLAVAEAPLPEPPASAPAQPTASAAAASAAPAPTRPPAPAVTPTAAPEPAATAPRIATKPASSAYKSKIDSGWSKVETDPDSAADAFRDALDLKPGDAEASYGLGYSMLKLGQKNGARAYLCAGMKSAEARTASEIRAVLANASMSCE